VTSLEIEAKAKLSADVAIENYSFCKPEVDTYLRASGAAYIALQNARKMLAELEKKYEQELLE
jgi:hypothetical protein